ncbi:MAG: CopG family transcriptional regulator [Acidobacteriota bacterium]
MKTLTIRVPKTLYADLTALAEHKGVSRSKLVRDALAEHCRRQPTPGCSSALALLEDLAGSVEGPEDLSFNKAHLDKLGH